MGGISGDAGKSPESFGNGVIISSIIRGAKITPLEFVHFRLPINKYEARRRRAFKRAESP